MSIDDALQAIQPGQTIAFGMNGNIPAGLCHALGKRLPSLPGLHLTGTGAPLSRCTECPTAGASTMFY